MDWKSILRGVMPIASTIIGTANPLAGFALKKASEALLGKPDGTEEEVSMALANATPDQIASMRDADQAFKLELDKNKIKLEEIDAEDRDSARDMKIKTGSNAQDVLAGLFVSGYFVLLYMLMTGGVIITDKNQAIIYTLVGIMSASVTQIMNFYFGSSKGSKDKTQALSNALKNH